PAHWIARVQISPPRSQPPDGEYFKPAGVHGVLKRELPAAAKDQGAMGSTQCLSSCTLDSIGMMSFGNAMPLVAALTLLLLAPANANAAPCDSLIKLQLANTTITSARIVSPGAFHLPPRQRSSVEVFT